MDERDEKASEQISVLLTPSQLDRLRALARVEERPVAQLARVLLARALRTKRARRAIEGVERE